MSSGRGSIDFYKIIYFNLFAILDQNLYLCKPNFLGENPPRQTIL